MWLFTPFGFFSVVVEKRPTDPKDKGDLLVIRARVKGDLEALTKKYITDASPITSTPGRDYPYRVWVWVESLARAMPKIVKDITYTNFKSEVWDKQSHNREKLYAQVWSVMNDAERKLKDMEKEDKKFSGWTSKYDGKTKQRDFWASGHGTHRSSTGKSYAIGSGGTLEELEFPKHDEEEDTDFTFGANSIGVSVEGLTPLNDDSPPDEFAGEEMHEVSAQEKLKSLVGDGSPEDPAFSRDLEELDADLARVVGAEDSEVTRALERVRKAGQEDRKSMFKPLLRETQGHAEGVPCPWCGEKMDVTEAFPGELPTEGTQVVCPACDATDEIKRVRTSNKGHVIVTLRPVEDEADHIAAS